MEIMKTRKKKTDRQKQVIRMDQKFGIIIRSGLRCLRCGKLFILTDSSKIPQGLHCSHFVSRKRFNTRWDKSNCKPLCYGCHSYFDQNKDLYREWLIQLNYHTEDSLDIMIQRSNQIFRGDLNAIELWIDQELKELNLDFNYEFLK